MDAADDLGRQYFYMHCFKAGVELIYCGYEQNKISISRDHPLALQNSLFMSVAYKMIILSLTHTNEKSLNILLTWD